MMPSLGCRLLLTEPYISCDVGTPYPSKPCNWCGKIGPAESQKKLQHVSILFMTWYPGRPLDNLLAFLTRFAGADEPR